MLKSKKGSVRMLSGDFYTHSWQLVFTPLDNAEIQKFLNLINNAEGVAGRILTDSEIMRWVNVMLDGGA
jgi:hypothetical protein